MPDSATRVVSLHDVDARPIRRGRLGHPNEFGYKAQVVDNDDDGVIVDHIIEPGNPADAPQLAPAIARATRRAGRPPRAVPPTAATATPASTPPGTTWESVPSASPQRAARTGPPRHRAPTTLPRPRQVAYGCEGRIAHLKRRSGWDRTLLDGLTGARIWCGHGVFTHNLTKISALAG
jgi:IS5 family transposase